MTLSHIALCHVLARLGPGETHPKTAVRDKPPRARELVILRENRTERTTDEKARRRPPSRYVRRRPDRLALLLPGRRRIRDDTRRDALPPPTLWSEPLLAWGLNRRGELDPLECDGRGEIRPVVVDHGPPWNGGPAAITAEVHDPPTWELVAHLLSYNPDIEEQLLREWGITTDELKSTVDFDVIGVEAR